MSKNSSSFLGQEVTYNADEGTVVHFHSEASGGGFSLRGGGGSTAPAPTLVPLSAGSNLQFNLIWDSSVNNVGTHKADFMNAVINVATYYEKMFTTAQHEIINIKVGWGEINGQALPNGALGASETNGYLTNYATVTSKLIANSGGQITAASFGATNEPTTAQFFISSAEAKGFGLISPTSTGVDGYMGFGTLGGTGYSWNFTSNAGPGAGGTGTTQFDFQGVVQHEISEVMGRIEMEGHTTIYGKATYTPLDLFNYDAPNHLVLSGGDNTGTQVNSYFSLDSGKTALGYFNDGYQGGDIADWASWTSPSQAQTDESSGYQDPFDAFGWPGIDTNFTHDDMYVMDTLGVWSTGIWIA